MSAGAWARAALAQSRTLLGWRTGRWTLGWALLATAATIVLFVLLSIGAGILLRDLSSVLGLDDQFSAASGERTGIIVGNPFSLVSFLLIGFGGFALAWAAAVIQQRDLRDWVTLGGAFSGRRFWRMAAAFALVQLITLPLLLAYAAEDVRVRPGAFADPLFLAACIALVAVQSFGEELFFRGFLFHAWGAVWPRPVPVAIGVSAFFALLHGWNPDITLDPIPGLLSIFLFGLFAQWLVARTGSLDAAWGLHFANNLVALLGVQTTQGYAGDASVIVYTDSVLAAGGSYATDPLFHCALFGGFAALAWLLVDRRSPFYLEPKGSVSDGR